MNNNNSVILPWKTQVIIAAVAEKKTERERDIRSRSRFIPSNRQDHPVLWAATTSYLSWRLAINFIRMTTRPSSCISNFRSVPFWGSDGSSGSGIGLRKLHLQSEVKNKPMLCYQINQVIEEKKGFYSPSKFHTATRKAKHVDERKKKKPERWRSK